MYIRTGRLPTGVITTEETPFEIGKAVTLREGKDVAIIACGIMVEQALLAAEALEAEGISAKVINMHTIKPLDVEAVKAAAECGAIVTAEEHSIIGGLGSAVSEVLADNRLAVAFERVGIQDRFGQSGKPTHLAVEYGLTDAAIAEAAKRVVSNK